MIDTPSQQKKPVVEIAVDEAISKNSPVETVVIRVAKQQDITTVADIAQQTFVLACPPTVKAENLQQYCQKNLTATHFTVFLQSTKHQLFVAEVNHKVVGFSLFQQINGNDAELSKVYILPAYHGNKLGWQLAIAVIDYAKQQFIKALYVSVYANNHKAKALYQKLGFHFVKKVAFNMGNEVHDDELFCLSLIA